MQQTHCFLLYRFIDEKLAAIADGSAAPLPHRVDPQEELEALKTEFPLEAGPTDPPPHKELD